jgi:hypothetical protein
MSRKPAKHSQYAGPTRCLRCDREFQSWDRRQNRLCPSCLQAIKEEASDEPSYALPTPIRRSRLREEG